MSDLQLTLLAIGVTVVVTVVAGIVISAWFSRQTIAAIFNSKRIPVEESEKRKMSLAEIIGSSYSKLIQLGRASIQILEIIAKKNKASGDEEKKE